LAESWSSWPWPKSTYELIAPHGKQLGSLGSTPRCCRLPLWASSLCLFLLIAQSTISHCAGTRMPRKSFAPRWASLSCLGEIHVENEGLDPWRMAGGIRSASCRVSEGDVIPVVPIKVPRLQCSLHQTSEALPPSFQSSRKYRIIITPFHSLSINGLVPEVYCAPGGLRGPWRGIHSCRPPSCRATCRLPPATSWAGRLPA
jgi:hypothetical protein